MHLAAWAILRVSRGLTAGDGKKGLSHPAYTRSVGCRCHVASIAQIGELSLQIRPLAEHRQNRPGGCVVGKSLCPRTHLQECHSEHLKWQRPSQLCRRE